MIRLLTPAPPGPRLRYTARVVFDLILQTEWSFATHGDYPNDGAGLWYAPTPPPEDARCFWIPACGLLDEARIHLDDVLPAEADLFARIFYLAAGYERFQHRPTDAHGRLLTDTLPSVRAGLHARPSVHLIAESLWAQLQRRAPSLQRRRRSFDWTISFDVDQPWAFLHKPAHIQAGGALRDLLHGRFAALRARAAAHLSGRDPFDTFNWTLGRVPAARTRWFWLLGGRTRFDNHFSETCPPLARLIRQIADAGAIVGAHPSWAAADDARLLHDELARMATVVGAPVTHSRQHFLRGRLPDYYRALSGAGVRHDYTTAYPTVTGFPHGMAVPFPWYDLTTEQETQLTLWPTHVMDRTLLSYLKLNVDDSIREMNRLIDEVEAVGGLFLPLFHNDALSNFGEWAGRRIVFERMLKRLGA